MKKIIFIAVSVFIISSCGLNNIVRESNFSGDQKPSIESVDHYNKSIKMNIIDKIPKYGITVIRFIDAGHTRYIAVKDDYIQVLSETSKTTKNGKSSITTYEDDSITLVNKVLNK